MDGSKALWRNEGKLAAPHPVPPLKAVLSHHMHLHAYNIPSQTAPQTQNLRHTTPTQPFPPSTLHTIPHTTQPHTNHPIRMIPCPPAIQSESCPFHQPFNQYHTHLITPITSAIQSESHLSPQPSNQNHTCHLSHPIILPHQCALCILLCVCLRSAMCVCAYCYVCVCVCAYCYVCVCA